ncbi:Unknown protein [Striga hermonthica]|uniref:FAR1 domain-containing protein n=1 Tax=Striga hermonthica TaxID=68872 RepID=A0A9N7NTM2_STRHE|nr:Unknown protein [Striga hermonthica]
MDNNSSVLEEDLNGANIGAHDFFGVDLEHPGLEAPDGEVQSSNNLVDVLEAKLAVGALVNSIEDAYLLYCQYAHAKGFSVRKGDQRCFPRSSEIQLKIFGCSCAGEKD